ncbi:uncharacterized protein CELE_D1046.16 [Caenorhabditis elegans]|uniref:Uncharacterized protein n=1 Tax=Caenorhabditis elegans TaxID=6239 RepID=I7LHV7_CAEEL|nr:Uncharacterized protein CELE_D1046.16 [Caenorhabditis elegans]CCJ09397.1 Uncharacterized protein CELE_D1046.16 [Caenorhabditis elegans]|eukprot:NP_001263759.1 Uncharacterized protein CELE_D1046.16 [Caenorhabditis elegans]
MRIRRRAERHARSVRIRTIIDRFLENEQSGGRRTVRRRTSSDSLRLAKNERKRVNLLRFKVHFMSGTGRRSRGKIIILRRRDERCQRMGGEIVIVHLCCSLILPFPVVNVLKTQEQEK